MYRMTRGNAWAASYAVLAGTLAVAACGTVSPARAGAPRAGAPRTVSGFRVLSMTFVSDQQGFALGTVRCATGRCLTLLGTSNGDRSWRRLTAPAREPGAGFDTCPNLQPCASQVRFATPSIGYAFGPSSLLTTDGGRHWQRLAGKNVSSLEIANGSAARVALSSMGCSGAPYKFQSAPIGTTTWQAISAPQTGGICPPVLYRQGSRMVLVDYGNPAGGVRATAVIDRSGDDGKSWASGVDRCGGKDGYASGVALAPPNVLVLLCQHQIPKRSGFGPAWIRVSADGGATYGPDEVVPSLTGGTIERYQIAAASSGQVLIAESGPHSSKVLLSQNGGHTWTATLTAPGSATVLLVGFQDTVTARVAQADTAWTTRNGGRTWTANQFG
jgi:photosystem II stability/assembly factor-like uncharacterized protein